MTVSISPSESFETDTLPHLAGLNGPQREAVECLDGPVLMLAGAGTGKTRTLTSRIVHLLYRQKAFPWEILAVTFTNKAAREMRGRVGAFLGDSSEQLRWMGTFHSICARILRRHAELAGLTPEFTILDKQDQQRLLKQLIDAEGLDNSKYPPRVIAAIIDGWKNRGWSFESVPIRENHEFKGLGIKLYRDYQGRLETLNAVDFGDLILKVVEVLKNNPDILEEYQNRFKYINVDEYQDTNTVQYLWLRLLTQAHANICCVGDDDQSIYGWRGADIQNILRFQEHFPNAKVFKLEQNYRSTGNILGAANGLIARNANRLGKSLWTNVPQGQPVRIYGHFSGKDEAVWIGDEIESMLRIGVDGRKFQPSEIAILVRASFLTRVIEDRFLLIGLPYNIVGGLRFYQRKEIKDAVAYFRLALSKSDSMAFERIANVPKRGVGPKAMQIIKKTAFENGISLPEAVESILREGKLRNPAAQNLRILLMRLSVWSAVVRDSGVSATDAAMQILDESGMTAALQEENTLEAESRLENLKELVTVIADFDNLTSFVEHISLMSDNEIEEDKTKVSIMTIHAAKGLEFPVIFLPGWEEEIFPSKRSLEASARFADLALEEERRLAYVGITRAKEICSISFASHREIYGRLEYRSESRFLRELPRAHVDMRSPSALHAPIFDFGNSASEDSIGGETFRAPGYLRMVEKLGRKQNSGIRLPKSAESRRGPYKAGDLVVHSRFGRGKVLGVNGDKCSVQFDGNNFKNVLASYLSVGD